nr:beta-ketoacyl synthase N-terminal-like domain-containing protein [Chryseolinea sp.]
MSKRIFITGFGIITSIGKNAFESLDSLLKERSGFGSLDILQTAHHHTIPACEIKLEDNDLHALAGVQPHMGFTRAASLGIIAAKEAIASANLSKKEIQNSALISATSAGGIRELEKYYYQLKDNTQKGAFEEFVDTGNPGEHTERMAEYFGVKKQIGTISTACSSSANAIM